VRPTEADEAALKKATVTDLRAAFERLRQRDEDEREIDELRDDALDAMATKVLTEAAKREREAIQSEHPSQSPNLRYT
jgi:hypothetical protein